MTDAVLSLREVCRVFPGPPQVTALQKVSLEFAPQTLTAITGPSGSGKSTLLNMLGLLDRPTSGEVRIFGKTVDGIGDRRLAQLRSESLGFVFQAFHLVPHEDVLTNVQMPLVLQRVPPAQRVARSIEVIEQLGLYSRVNAMPGTLSGGECQRVAIARALVTDPAILLCDEPTGNLDQANTTTIISILRELAHQDTRARSVVVVTHENDVANHADRIVGMQDGSVVTDRWLVS